MNKTIKTILIVVAIAILVYGGYQLITPEASVDIGIAEFESQNNKSAYTTIGVGVVILLATLLLGKNK
ncbi:hypothetical protein [Tenacibaculum sp. 1_MG-2023]|uniref:hypothetical protein n=1 Tax=Tenacibaculum sp. 1_MG-2023 TaxID=3062653 RepID=UPI0026E33193|nr:hypothetical protein [Tenacibaculum sp. 1_MG-2023]MDO6600191.1 hypothetical protein [Tenacibaculum sp. 1_MG-2023]